MGVCEKGTGRLLYNLSASDLRGMTVQKMHLLLRPVPEFLSQLGSRKLIFPITAQPETRVRDLLENLLGTTHPPTYARSHHNPGHTCVECLALTSFFLLVLQLAVRIGRT